MASKSFADLNEEMLKRMLDVNPDSATAIGLHDPYDDLMPHGGVERLRRSRDILVEWRDKAAAILKSKDLSVDERMELEGLKLSVKSLDFYIDDYPLWKMYPDALDLPGSLLFIMFSREYAPFEKRAASMASRLHKTPQYLEEFRTRFRGARSVRVWTDLAILSCDQLPSFLDFIMSYSKGKVPDKTYKEIRSGVDCTKEAIGAQKDWLEHLRDGAERNFPMGRKKFAKLMKLRGFDMTPDEMLVLGEKYLKELKEERARVAGRIAPGKGVDAAKEIVMQHSPSSFEEALNATRDEMEKAKQFIVKNGLATVDLDAKLSVVETPKFLAPLLPYAALFMPSLFDERQEGEYVVTRPSNPDDLRSHLNYAAITNTAVHEAYPGHFHQGVMINKKPWMLQTPVQFASCSVTNLAAETVEGWAHYCEKMMFDHGFGASDEEAFEMLNGAIWRACRIVADVKLANGDATIEEMVDLLVRETRMPKGASEDEVKRYSHTPGQALSYLMGRHLLLQFREDTEKKHGKRFNEKLFHDLVASYAYLPFSMMRDAVESSMAE